MITKVNPITGTGRAVKGGIAWSPKGATTGAIGNTIKTNRFSKSKIHTVLESNIQYWDDLYATFAPARKAGWDAIPPAEPFLQICGCTELSPGGQSVFRNTSLNLTMLGLAIVLDAPLLTTYYPNEVASLQYTPGFPPGLQGLYIYQSFVNQPFRVTFNLRHGLGNPVFLIDQTNYPTFYPITDSRVAVFAGVSNNSQVNYCTADLTGVPERSQKCPFQVF